MRMRLKRNLPSRLNACKEYLIKREDYDFYSLPDSQRFDVIDLNKVFGNNNPLVLELGCGKGDWAVTSAKNNPHVNYIAVEKLSNVIVEACEKAQRESLPNLRFINAGVENLTYFLPRGCADTIVLNFSCPFPKKTYANRRLTYVNYLEKYKLLLNKDGLITLKTDDKPFFDWSIESLTDNGFAVYDVTNDLHASASNDNVMTEYETKFVSQGIKINALKARLK